VTVQTKSEPPHPACREVEQHYFDTPRQGRHRFEQAVRAIGLRQIVAKTSIKTGITVPSPPAYDLDRSRQRSRLNASNMLM
jgi:hypothetical protein